MPRARGLQVGLLQVANPRPLGAHHPACVAVGSDHRDPQASHGTYGALRVQAELVHAQGVTVGHNTVALLMRRAGLAGRPLRRRAKKVPASMTVTDLVRREFTRPGPNQLWVTDITEHPTREGKLYCCVVIDTFSRRVVGWAIDSRARADLATNALGMAIESRADAAGQIPGGIIHGDHGTQSVHFVGLHRPSPPRRPIAIPGQRG